MQNFLQYNDAILFLTATVHVEVKSKLIYSAGHHGENDLIL